MGFFMRLIIGKDYEEMSQLTAQILLGTMHQNKKVNLAITAVIADEEAASLLDQAQ